ncbi:MAG: DUF3089 domain-containing protein [Sphingomonadales bacterium]
MKTNLAAALLCIVGLVDPVRAQNIPPAGPPVIAPGPAPDYANPDHWLCRPDHMAACTPDMTATVIEADGHLAREPFQAAANPKVDCFIVYPTTSLDNASNSDLVPGTQPGEEVPMVRRQFARFAQACRLFVPMYRSTTATALRGLVPKGDGDLAYRDVLSAWRHYLAHDNEGRGVVLIGHSQGTFHLQRLIAEEIDGKPDEQRIVSALLIGGGVSVRAGADIGGSFKHMPLCRSAAQLSCIVAYSTYRATSPPPANSIFGRSPAPGLQAACTNPAALGGGKAMLHPYLMTHLDMVPGGRPQMPWTNPEKPIETAYVTAPGMLSGECVSDAHGTYLAISLNVRPTDHRVHDIQGDVDPGGTVRPEFGLHLVDFDVAMGDLIALVGNQAESWIDRHR